MVGPATVQPARPRTPHASDGSRIYKTAAKMRCWLQVPAA
jgi:hypothetical protein